MGNLNAQTSIEDHTLCLDNRVSQLLPEKISMQDGT